MKVLYRNMSILLLSLLASGMMILQSSCEKLEIIEPIGYDSVYQIRFYAMPPYVKFEQGYWVRSDSTERFINLDPAKSAPFYLLVRLKNAKDTELLDYMQEMENSVIEDLQKISDSDYLITASQYFECPKMFVSVNYTSKESSGFIHVLPQIMVKMKEGRSTHYIETKYKSAISTNNKHEGSLENTYIYNCSQSNSYQILQVASEIYKEDDVEWAEADMMGGFEAY